MSLANLPQGQFAQAWARSVRYGVDSTTIPPAMPIKVDELQRRLFANRRLLESAIPFIDHFYRTVESECIVALCDADGILLAARGERLPDELLMQHTTPGVSWHERVFGANALGTTLAEDRPVHMVGEDHFIRGFHGMSCAATPVHDPSGKLVGGLAIAAFKTEHSPYMLGTVMSIGHAIEQAMVLRTEHYRTLLLKQKIIETTRNPILITDKYGLLLHMNDSARDLYGMEQAVHLKDIFPEKSVAFVALNQKRDVIDFLQAMTPSGCSDEQHISWDARWVDDPTNNQSKLLLCGRDMTKYVRLERTMKQAERLSTMGKFAAQIAHEIRNPVAVIKLAMQLMLTQEEFSEKSEKKGKMILAELRRIEELVNHFLQISKPQHPQIGECDIVQLLGDMCSLMQGVFLQGNVQLVESYEFEGTMFVDCDQLHQVFLNLLNNSIDAMPDGGQIEVVVKRDEEEPDFVSIRISDTGQGIPEDRLQDIFEPFYTTKSKGTGLGLNNAKQIIEAHGGDMEVESTLDHGTIISIWLPIDARKISAVQDSCLSTE